ncbi:MAG: chemotaxis protein CheW [Candidatus Hydrogenedentes bacterium]|nr:chemotaxis protein CheW [Candidatus Hydrogenedentota bacterium]
MRTERRTRLELTDAVRLEQFDSRNLAGKYLTFKLDTEIYGLEILSVHEIIGIMHITHVPRTPSFVRGVINLRGKVISVVDLRVQFGMERCDDSSRTCIIVVQVALDAATCTVGLIVDEVSEVVDIRPAQIEPPPSFASDDGTGFILGVGKLGDKVVMLLDTDRILSRSELAAMTTAL